MHCPHLLLLNVLKIQGTVASRLCICICCGAMNYPWQGSLEIPFQGHGPGSPTAAGVPARMGTACAAVGAAWHWAGRRAAAWPLALSPQLIAGPRGWAPVSGSHHPWHIQLWGVRRVTVEQRQLRGHPRAACSHAVVPEAPRRCAAGGLLGGLLAPVIATPELPELLATGSGLVWSITLCFPCQRLKAQC